MIPPGYDRQLCQVSSTFSDACLGLILLSGRCRSKDACVSLQKASEAPVMGSSPSVSRKRAYEPPSPPPARLGNIPEDALRNVFRQLSARPKATNWVE